MYTASAVVRIIPIRMGSNSRVIFLLVAVALAMVVLNVRLCCRRAVSAFALGELDYWVIAERV